MCKPISSRRFEPLTTFKVSGAIALLCALLCLPAEFCEAEERIKIGVSTALSGNAASYGTDIKNALVFANETLGENRYELLIEDDQCIDREAVSIANKFVHVDKVKYVLGFGCSGAVLAAAPIYERAGVVVIASGTGAPAISQAGDFIFRTKPSLNLAAKVLQESISSQSNSVGIVTEETAYCQGLTDSVLKLAANNRLVATNENYAPQTTDFRTTLLRLKKSGVGAVFLNPQAEPGFSLIFKQLKELNWHVPVYGNFFPGSPSFLNTFGKKGDGVLFTDLAFNDQYLNARGVALIKGFEAKFGKPQSAEHFVTLSILAFQSLHQAVQSGAKVKDYLYQHTFRELVEGGYTFDENGDIRGERLGYVLKVVRDGVPAAR
jgi:branched-chain amino acid transport system substrate-binding protein